VEEYRILNNDLLVHCTITHYALRITHYALRITHYALRITHYALRVVAAHEPAFPFINNPHHDTLSSQIYLICNAQL
jgi:hypothetical protein